MSKKQDGIVMVNGVVIKDGLNKFKADKKMVSNSLIHIAKMSKGLYSGILNSDLDFQDFQKDALDSLVEKETDKICKQVITNAEQMLKKISDNMVSQKIHEVYARDRYGVKYVTPIKIKNEEEAETKSNGNKTVAADKVKGIVDDKISKIEGFGEEELKYIKQVNKKVQESMKAKKKVVKKKVNKKNSKK